MAIRQENVVIDFEVRVQNAIRDLQKAKRVVVSLEADTEDAAKSIRDAFTVESIDDLIKSLKVLERELKDVDRQAGKLDDTFDKQAGGLQRIGELTAGISIAGLLEEGVERLIQFGVELADRAVELEGIESRFNEVFDDSAQNVEDYGRTVARTLGLSIAQYKEAAAGAGDLLIPLGFLPDQAAELSKSLIDLSGPLSQWVGGTKTGVEVSTILTKALLGEREELKQLGVAINEAEVQQKIANDTTGKFNGLLESQAKALATIDILYEKTVDAQVAFSLGTNRAAAAAARSSAEFNELIDNLARGLAPVVTDLQILFGNLISQINRLIAPTRSAIAVFDQQNATFQALSSTLPILVAEYQELSNQSELSADQQQRLADVTNQIGQALPQAVSRWDQYGNAITISAEQVAKLTEEQRILNEQVREAAISQIDKEVESLKALNAELSERRENIDAEVNAAALFGATVDRNERLLEIAGEQAENAERINDLLRQRSRIVGETVSATDDATESTEKVTAAEKDRLNTIQALRREIKRLKDENETLDFTDQSEQIARNNALIEQYETQIKNLTGSTEKATKAGAKFTDTLKTLQEAVQDVTFENIVDDAERELRQVQAAIERQKTEFAGLISETIAGPEERERLSELFNQLENQLQIFFDRRKEQIERANLELPPLLPTAFDIQQAADKLNNELIKAVAPVLENLDEILGINTDVVIDAEVTTNLKPPETGEFRDRLTEVVRDITGGFDSTFRSLATNIENVATAVGPALQAITDIARIQIETLDAAIDAQKTRVDAAVRIADQGNAELLQAETERLERLQIERERAAEKERQLAAGQIAVSQALAVAQGIQALLSAFATGGPAGIALGIAAGIAIAASIGGMIAAISGAFGNLPTFRTGTDYLSGKSGGIPVVAHEGERIMTKGQNRDVGGKKITNEQVVKYAKVGQAIEKFVGPISAGMKPEKLIDRIAESGSGVTIIPIHYPVDSTQFQPTEIEFGDLVDQMEKANKRLNAITDELIELRQTAAESKTLFRIDETGISAIVRRRNQAENRINNLLR